MVTRPVRAKRGHLTQSLPVRPAACLPRAPRAALVRSLRGIRSPSARPLRRRDRTSAIAQRVDLASQALRRRPGGGAVAVRPRRRHRPQRAHLRFRRIPPSTSGEAAALEGDRSLSRPPRPEPTSGRSVRRASKHAARRVFGLNGGLRRGGARSRASTQGGGQRSVAAAPAHRVLVRTRAGQGPRRARPRASPR